MKITNLLPLLLLFTGVLLSCKKEKQIERNLWKDGGEWKIESVTFKQTSTNSADNFTETIYNYGSYNFDKDGNGSYSFTIDGNEKTGDLTYSNTKNEFTLTIDEETRVFDLEWEEDKMEISIEEKSTAKGETITMKETQNLKKK